LSNIERGKDHGMEGEEKENKKEKKDEKVGNSRIQEVMLWRNQVGIIFSKNWI
jgi:hypothetical protein